MSSFPSFSKQHSLQTELHVHSQTKVHINNTTELVWGHVAPGNLRTINISRQLLQKYEP